jgi:hypothetical protein
VLDVFLHHDRRPGTGTCRKLAPLDDHGEDPGQPAGLRLDEVLVHGLDDKAGAAEGATGRGKVGGDDGPRHGHLAPPGEQQLGEEARPPREKARPGDRRYLADRGLPRRPREHARCQAGRARLAYGARLGYRTRPGHGVRPDRVGREVPDPGDGGHEPLPVQPDDAAGRVDDQVAGCQLIGVEAAHRDPRPAQQVLHGIELGIAGAAEQQDAGPGAAVERRAGPATGRRPAPRAHVEDTIRRCQLADEARRVIRGQAGELPAPARGVRHGSRDRHHRWPGAHRPW